MFLHTQVHISTVTVHHQLSFNTQTHIRVSVPQQFVEDVAELPAQNRVAGERQAVHRRPEGVRPLLMVGAQDAR